MASKQSRPVVSDSRFAAVHTDPRFQRFPKFKRTVEVDERFAGMFNDPEFQGSAAVDKRGRKVGKKKQTDDLKRYYRLRDEEEWRADAAGNKDAAGQPAKGAAAAGKQRPKQPGAIASAPKVSKSDEGAQRPAAAAGKVGTGKVPPIGRGKALLAAPPISESDLEEPEEDSDGGLESEEEPGGEAEGTEDSSAEREGDDEEAEGAEDSGPEGEGAGAEAELRKRWARARGLIAVSSSDEAAGSESEELDSADEELSDDEAEDVEELEKEWGVGAYALNPEEPIPQGDETRRLAVVDLDWERLRAVDILAALRSFLPKAAEISRVTVYPSDYGLQRITEEATHGPQGLFRKGTDKAPEEEEAEEEEDEEGGPRKGKGAGRKVQGSDDEEEEGGEGLDKLRLRLYERSKLRWYYAIVECDTVATALTLYNECDGMELERSACKLDLRFVPDDQDFSTRQVRDSATSVPAEYEPPQFASSLQFSKPKLTWDAEDEGRKKVLMRRVTDPDAIKDDDFAAYLGSDDEGEEEADEGGDAEAIRQRYLGLLLAGTGDKADGKKAGKGWGGHDEGGNDEGSEGEDEDAEEEGGAKPSVGARVRDKGGMEMEVTFMPGLEGLGERLLAKKREAQQREGETVWEAYLRRKREKKKAAKALGRRHGSSSDDDSEDGIDPEGAGGAEEGDGGEGADDGFFQHEDDPFSDPFFQDAEAADQELTGTAAAEPAGKKSKKGKKGRTDEEKKALDKATKRQEKEEEAKRKAELELLVMDDTALQMAARGVGTAASTSGRAAAAGGSGGGGTGAAAPAAKPSKKDRREQRKAAKAVRRRGSDDDEEMGDGFQADLTDPRFSAMLSSHEFALDPTDPNYQRSTTTKKLLAQRQEAAAKLPKKQRLAASEAPPQEAAPRTDGAAAAAAGNGMQLQQQGDAGSQLELRAMVAKLKRKTQVAQEVAEEAAQAGQSGKKKRRQQK